MTREEQVREVLDILVRDCILIAHTDFMIEYKKKQASERVDQAISQIHSFYLGEFEKMLPREVYGGDFDIKGYNQGFNSCIAEIKAKLKETK